MRYICFHNNDLETIVIYKYVDKFMSIDYIGSLVFVKFLKNILCEIINC